jgi:hypothetical protein
MMPNEISNINSGPRQLNLLSLSTKGGATRWLEQRLSSYSTAKESFVLTITLLVAFLGGPALVFYGMNWLLAGSLGTSGGGAAAIAFNNLLYGLLLCLTTVSGWLAIKTFTKPTHLLLTSDGLQYLYKTPIGTSKGPLVLWERITELKIEKPTSHTNPAEYQLCFLAGGKRVLSLQLGWINIIGERQKLFEHVEEFLTDVPRSIDVALYLQPPSGQSYTEIWFQSLENAPSLGELTTSAQSQSITSQNNTIR